MNRKTVVVNEETDTTLIIHQGDDMSPYGFFLKQNESHIQIVASDKNLIDRVFEEEDGYSVESEDGGVFFHKKDHTVKIKENWYGEVELTRNDWQTIRGMIK